MPYSKKLIESRKHAAQAGSNLRAVLRDVEKQAFYPPHRQRVVSAIQAALKVLYDCVDYDDDGSVLGIVGEYERTSNEPEQHAYIERDTGAPVKAGKVRDLVYSLSRAKSNDVEGIEFLVHTTNLNDAISLLEQLADKLE